MGDLVLKGSTSGQITVTPTAVAGTNTLTLPAVTGNIITSADSGTVTGTMLASATVTGSNIASATVAQSNFSNNVAGNGPAFGANCTTAQSIPNSTWTKVQMSNEDFDTNNNYDTSTYRFTATVAGYYQINWFVVISALTAEFIPGLYKNGSLYQWAMNLSASGGHYNAGGAGVLIYLNATDYVECYVFQNSGGALSLQGTSRFNGVLVRAA